MRVICSHPTRRGGSINFEQPVTGVAWVAVEDRVFPLRIQGATLSQIEQYAIDGIALSRGEVWFEDDREEKGMH